MFSLGVDQELITDFFPELLFGRCCDLQYDSGGERNVHIGIETASRGVPTLNPGGQSCSILEFRRAQPVVLAAKNALFAGHDEGARAWGRIASLIETCKMNGVEPYAWLKETLEKIAAGHPNSRIDELLPWNFITPSS